MILKQVKIWGMFLLILLLAGCGSDDVPYDATLFQANEKNVCWPCQMYMQAFKAIDAVLDGALDKISQNSLRILELGLICWLLFRVTRLVVAFSMPDMKKEFVSFITVLFKAMIVALFLNNPTYIYDFFGKVVIQPLGDGFLSLSKTVLEAPTTVGISFNYTNTGIGKLLEEMLSTLHMSSSDDLAMTSKMFGELAVTVQSIVYQIYDALWKNIGLGFQLWTSKGFAAIVAGIILIAGMLWLMIMIPLSFVDAFIRIGMILILLPLLLVSWVFSYPDKNLVQKQFKNLFSGFFDILFNCIYITFLVSTFRVYEKLEMPYMFSSSYQTTEGGMRVVGTEFGTDFIILTVLAWAMVRLSSKIQDFSGYFFASAGESSMFGMINKLKNFATKGVRIGTAILSGPVEMAKETARAVKDGVQKEMQGEDQEEKTEDNKDNSQKASKQNAAPKPKGDKK